ncbi:class I SAM-dependent methyltransferase [Phytohabitans kaempferiae]|uniref:Class I SAM-dependent methyltransferase n=1 Tax=Phytohabitans kaempferiae TaxID=1620943 RepID=A0ABV6M8X0_9ACTN
MTSADLDSRLVGYLTANRDFVDAAVAQAIAALDLPVGGRVLDMGTGAGGAIPHLANAVGPSGQVLAIDLNPAVADLAAAHAASHDVAKRVTVQAGDATGMLTEEAFDAIWSNDVIWPGNFDDPAAVVAQMARAVRPGGRRGAVPQQLLPGDVPARSLTAGAAAARGVPAAMEPA